MFHDTCKVTAITLGQKSDRRGSWHDSPEEAKALMAMCSRTLQVVPGRSHFYDVPFRPHHSALQIVQGIAVSQFLDV